MADVHALPKLRPLGNRNAQPSLNQNAVLIVVDP